MKHLIFILFLVIASSAHAKLTLELEVPQVQLGQTFRLVLTQDDVQARGVPNLTPLQTDFNIVGTERSTNYTVINGQASAINQWIVLLMPKKTGTLVIPPLNVGQEQTKATSIIVSTGSSLGTPATADSIQDLMLVAQVSNEHPQVNEQVLYTVKLYNSRRLLDASYEPPSIENGLLIPVGSGRHYQTTENGRLYTVEEQQYAIFPQKSGKITINPPTINALIYDTVPQPVSVKAARLTLEVQPIPNTFKGIDWLPAKQVTLSESYDKNLEKLTKGSTVTRLITLRAVGFPSQLLPKLTFSNTHSFSVYPEKATQKNTFQREDIIGSSTIKVIYLLNHAGKVVLPVLKLPWFNTVTGKQEIAILPEQTIEVITTGEEPVDQEASSGSLTAESSSISESIPAKKSLHSRLPWWLAGGFAGAWLVTLLSGWYRRGPSRKKDQKKIMARLKDACLNNQPQEARMALLDWGRQQWSDKALLNLADLQQLNLGAEFKKQISKLLNISYSSNPQPWQGEALWLCIVAYKKSNKQREANNDSLPPINP